MSLFACPVCQTTLTPAPRVWACENGHHFDVARPGYVNLLPVQFKHSKQPGDTPESLQARAAFLQAGHFHPLRDALQQCLEQFGPVAASLDLGCGEGYYTEALRDHSEQVIGLDIAKAAIVQAIRQSPKTMPPIQWLVASGAHLPIADKSIDRILSFFAPLPLAELQRVLKGEGHLIVARPAANHLTSFRKALFGEIIKQDQDTSLTALGEAFQRVFLDTIDFELRLSPESLKQLLIMTPYGWKAQPERRQALIRQVETDGEWTTSASVQLSVWQGKPTL